MNKDKLTKSQKAILALKAKQILNAAKIYFKETEYERDELDYQIIHQLYNTQK